MTTAETMRTWKFERCESLPAGPWRDEPDKAQWIDEATGLDCLILRNRLGALCGYVGLPPEHPWHGRDYEEPDVEVHGGLTFADRCAEGRGDDAICHTPEPGRPADIWWLGFDTAHLHDLVPSMIEHDAIFDRDVYRTFDYVRDECASLASQLAAVSA